MGAVFVSYRRGDAAGAAGRLFDRLEAALGRERVFMDVDSIEPGVDFVEVLDRYLAECDVVIAVIGPNWLRAIDTQGRRRLDDEADFVRLEIASALARGIRVIPILVDGATAVAGSDLPEDLRKLARRQAIEIRHERFGSDAEQLVSVLHKIIGETSLKPPEPVMPQAPGRPIGTWQGEVVVSEQVLKRTWVLLAHGIAESPHNEFGFAETGAWRLEGNDVFVVFQSGSSYRGTVVGDLFSGTSDASSTSPSVFAFQRA